MRSGVAVSPSSSSRLEPLEQATVARRGGVVELVDDDHVEVLRTQARDRLLGQRLDHREDVRTAGDSAAAMNLAERAVAQHGAERRAALLEDSLAVGDEQQRQIALGLRSKLRDSRARRRRSSLSRSPPRQGSDGVRDAPARPSAARASAAGADRHGRPGRGTTRSRRRRDRDGRRAPDRAEPRPSRGRTARSARTPSSSRTSTGHAERRAARPVPRAARSTPARRRAPSATGSTSR